MFHMFKIKPVMSCSPKIYSEMNSSYEHFAELVFQSLDYFTPSVKASADADMYSTSSCWKQRSFPVQKKTN